MMVQLPRRPTSATPSPYHALGLKDLPFPTTAISDPYNSDPRRNGTIYAIESIRTSIDKFERLLIRPNDFQNRARLAYLWSRGDQESGRGIGKTALLRYFRQRINHDWGQTEYKGAFSAVVVYVSFSTQVDRRWIEQLALSALVDICKNGVLESSRAALRLEQLTPQQAQDIITESDGTESPANLLDDSLLADRGVDVASIDNAVYEFLVQEGVKPASALALSQGNFEDHLKSYRRDYALVPFYIPRDTKILDYARDLLFNDIVLYLRAAGFAGGYLFIDDIENLVDQMPRRYRIEFAKEFAICTMRPGYASGTHNFFSCVLTTHLQASVALAAAWGEAGLTGIARLDPNDPNSVELPLPSVDQAKGIIVAHLDHYRMNSAENGSISPFTEDGISALLNNRQHPRILLSTAALVVSNAAQEGITSIDATAVNKTIESGAVQSSPDYTEGIEGAF
ncbi:MAG: hypothetical protein OXE50_14670 [Chloroflexi bacterium]|nr:hypothetical protein [Chloroflexota bacterium]